MENLNNRINKLKKLTEQLAKEIEYEDNGNVLNLLKLILDSVKSPAFVITKNFDVVFLNKEAGRLGAKYNIDIDMSKKCYEMQYGLDEPCKNCPVSKALKSKKIENIEWTSSHSGRTYMITDIPLLYNGIAGVIEILNPISRIKNGK